MQLNKERRGGAESGQARLSGSWKAPMYSYSPYFSKTQASHSHRPCSRTWRARHTVIREGFFARTFILFSPSLIHRSLLCARPCAEPWGQSGWDLVPARGPMREAALYSPGCLASDMCHSFIPSFSKCWLSACHVPGTVLTLGHQHDQSR